MRCIDITRMLAYNAARHTHIIKTSAITNRNLISIKIDSLAWEKRESKEVYGISEWMKKKRDTEISKQMKVTPITIKRWQNRRDATTTLKPDRCVSLLLLSQSDINILSHRYVLCVSMRYGRSFKKTITIINLLMKLLVQIKCTEPDGVKSKIRLR